MGAGESAGVHGRSAGWVEVDLAAIRSNVASLKAAAGSAELMAVVKADAYGHGLVESAGAARTAGAEWLGVAFLSEALALREAGDVGRILAWLHPADTDFGPAVAAGVEVSVGAVEQLAAVVSAARQLGLTAPVHLKADTGLTRGGATVVEWPGLVAAAADAAMSGHVEVTGIWSHLSHGEHPLHDTVDAQCAAFFSASEVASRAGFAGAKRHLANSGATLSRADLAFDIVRPGLGVYGIAPGEEAGPVALTPAMSVHTSVAMVKQVAAGVGVSYGHRYTTGESTRVALIPMGYADGLPRAASNRGPLLVGRQRVTIAGSVCMDQVVVDLGPGSRVRVGDPVVVLGPGANGEPTAAEWAVACDTIVWEILTRFGTSLPRRFVNVEGQSQ